MKSTVVWALSALNVLLLVLLVARSTGENAAMAQAGGRPGDYLMIPGTVIGGSNGVVYVLDQSAHQLSAMSYDDSMKKMEWMAPIDVDRAMGAMQRRGR
jgi:hypothetical protein